MHQRRKLFVLLLIIYSSLMGQSFNSQLPKGLEELSHNNGIAIADFDLDGNLDFYIIANLQFNPIDPKTANRLFRNNNDGSFTDVTETSGLLGISAGIDDDASLVYNIQKNAKNGAAWGDYNNDGFPDLYLSSNKKNQLIKNNGDGTFSEVTVDAGLDGSSSCYSTSACWFDFNNDGHLDLLNSFFSPCDGTQFYLNNGDGTFSSHDEVFNSIDSLYITWMVLPLDVNEDGWIDLYFANDFIDSKLLINEEGQFYTDASEEYDMVITGFDMGIASGDLNRDGKFDYYITDINENNLFINKGDRFENLAPELLVEDAKWAWQVQLEDMDLDGNQDIIVTNGFSNNQPNFYFQNEFNGSELSFGNKSNLSGFDISSNGRSHQAFDYDHDGDLDVLISNIFSAPAFLENTLIKLPSEDDSNWLKVSLEGSISNRDGIGSTVRIKTGDDLPQYRYYTGVSLLSQSLQPIYFGVGNHSVIDELVISWPSGHIDQFENLPTNKTIHVTEAEGFEILTFSNNKIAGCTDVNSCSYNPQATIDDGSCMYLDSKIIDGNSTSGQLSIEAYNYAANEGSTLKWTIEGGELVKGQGTSSIEVKWGISSGGKVAVVEQGSECYSQSIELSVALTLSNLSDEISIARVWNEVLLEAIRSDFARPTVHARNLFHISAAMYDAWAVFDNGSLPYLEANQEISFPLDNLSEAEIEEARNQAISQAAYRLLKFRFNNSPGKDESLLLFDQVMSELGYPLDILSGDFSEGNSLNLGNYIAQQYINMGASDGSREEHFFNNEFYEPVNESLVLTVPGNPTISDPNRWQPLTFDTFVDQSGNVVNGTTPEFLSPEWGQVKSFALGQSHLSEYNRDSHTYRVFHDPGAPPLLNTSSEEYYKWGFSLVAMWGSHLDPNDGVMWDISPGSIGNADIEEFPVKWEDHNTFYKGEEGGDISEGHEINPVTNAPYEPNVVPRGDYARVLAEFWADGPDSETPPGHWFTILNYVSDNPLLEKKLEGTGDVLSALEWDVKSYFTLGGAMHDAAIAAWSIKGWYDYIRPISAIRHMTDLGQSSDPEKKNFHEDGIPLIEGYIEEVLEGDPLEGREFENIGKIKLKTWRGHDFIVDTNADEAGVGWILAENWWPYQRPSFVTPPFAGYVSGHSTFSRAAAEVMTLLTGSAYFPGGIGEFIAHKNEFLVFEEGPSVDVTLQWATYRDASDQCSLSRIWGGIHPPADDIPGRLIGEQVGVNSFDKAITYFSSNRTLKVRNSIKPVLYPNPIKNGQIFILRDVQMDEVRITDLNGQRVPISTKLIAPNSVEIRFSREVAPGIYLISTSRGTFKVLVY